MLIYFDLCCFNRPFDEQSDIVIRLETEAKLFIQQLVRDRKLNLAWSAMLDYENQFNPSTEVRRKIADWKWFAAVDTDVDDFIRNKLTELMALGIKHKDAMHIAGAIAGKADFFITVDKRLLNKSVKKITILNPLTFVERYRNGNLTIME